MKMWRKNRKLILMAAVIAVVLVGSISGVVLAQGGSNDDSHQGVQKEALLDKVCAIYEENTGTAIDAEQLQEAFKQARSEARDEALDERLQGLVDEGIITQEEADQYKEWLEAKPDVPAIVDGLSGSGLPGGVGEGGGFSGGDESMTEE